ncbi:MAG: lysostaphin resistance A-like protein [Candidatus Odinarchaeota archaeon]
MLLLTLVGATCLFATIYGTAFVFTVVIVKIKPFIGKNMERDPWRSALMISPVVGLTSLLLIFFLSQGQFTRYGLRGLPVEDLLIMAVEGLVTAAGLLLAGEAILTLKKSPRSSWFAGTTLKERTFASLLLVLFPSVSEELAFRSAIQLFVDSREGFPVPTGLLITPGVLTAAVLFSVIHVPLVTQKPSLEVFITVVIALIMGIIAGVFVNQSGSLLPAIVLHAEFNLLGAIIEMVRNAKQANDRLEFPI